MQLIIDVGNTRVKVGVFKDDHLIVKKIIEKVAFASSLDDLVRAYPIKKALISSVGLLSEKAQRLVQLRFPTVLLSHETALPFVNDYSTPETLGVDRMGLVAAFAKAYPSQNGLIIDAGSCITYDFITAEGRYKGGAISPGIRLRYKAMHTYTANLPLLSPEVPESMIGTSTEMAMHSGVICGVAAEMDGIINRYKEDFLVDTVILTGGDTEILSKQLKNSIFAHSNFLLEGLNYILTHSND